MKADNSMNFDLIKEKMEKHIKDADLKTKVLKIADTCKAEGNK